MKKISFLDVLFWLFLLIAIGYVIAKLTGLFSPEWVELLPIISIIFAAGIVYQKLISFMQTVDRRTDYLKIHLDKVEEKQIENDKRVLSLKTKQDLILDLLKKRK